MTAQVRQQARSGPVVQELVQQYGRPDADAENTAGNESRRWWCGNNARVTAALASGAITRTMAPSAVSTHLDFEDGRVFRTRKRGKGQATARTLALVLWEVEDLLVYGQMGVIAALVALGVRLLAAPAAFRRWRERGGGRSLGREGRQGSGGRRGFRLATEELLFSLPQESLELVHFVLEKVFTSESALVQSLPVASLL